MAGFGLGSLASSPFGGLLQMAMSGPRDPYAAPGRPPLPEVGGPPRSDALSVRVVPSKALDPSADPRATEIQLIDKSGIPHYRGEITNEGNGIFGVGYVENLTRKYSGLGVDLYRAMARAAEDMGGRLIGGMNANRTSRAVHDALIKQGLARPTKVYGKDLLEFSSSPFSE